MSDRSDTTRPTAPEAKRALLARLLEEKAARGAVFGLSRGQEALWHLQRLAPQSSAYNVAFSGTIRSAVDVEKLRRAFVDLTKRHEMLRARFDLAHDGPIHRIHSSVEVALDAVDATSWSGPELQDRLVALSRQPFDLEREPIFRLNLFKRAPAEYVLLLTIHHIAIDGTSLGILVHDWLTGYGEQRNEAAPSPEPVAARYSDFVRWQESLLSNPTGEKAWAYWRTQLQGPLPSLDLPGDYPRPAEMSFRGATYSFAIDETVSTPLGTLARGQDTTLFVVLLASFWTLLSRYSGLHDIVVGSPTAGRSQREFERVVGYFVNPVALRGDLTGDPTFLGLLARARETVLDALRNADFPFPTLVRRLNPHRDPSRSPIFQAEISLLNLGQLGGGGAADGDPSSFAVGGLRVEPLPIPQQEGQFDLTLELLERPGSLQANLKYATDLFGEETIRRMAAHFQELLRGIVRRPESRLSDLPLLTVSEVEARRRWNRTEAPIPAPCVHELISARSREAPARVALESGGNSLSYAELERRSEELARRLRALGVQPGVRVGVYLERGLEMVVSLLGVLKAGGAYVPLDPAFPSARLSYMVEDSGAAVLVTHGEMGEGLPTDAIPVARVEEENDETGEALEGPGAGLEDLAYVIYTSGSTGKPKGVAVTHGNLVNFLSSMGREPGLGEGDVLLSVTTLSFDIAALELYLPLMVGGRVVVASREEASDGRLLLKLLEGSGATVMQATPATWRLLIEAGWESSPGLKVLCGGEALARDLADELVRRAGEVWNVYGPTETTVWSSLWRVEPGEGAISIGRPIANTQMHVLDEHLNPQPVGVPGELYIGGAGVAWGYWERPELTTERFVSDPFSEKAGARMYRTGDLARWLSDGRLECLGRIDHQVKVRGFRIELGEIETLLERHEAIRQAVVVAREDVPGDRRLVGYVVSEPGASPGDLRASLGRTLPEYMVPSAFVTLESFPLTPNGKVDRKVLPAPEGSHEPDGKYAAPRTPTEEILAGIWSEVLAIERVGAEDDFFALGGHSLLAAQVVSRVRRALDQEFLLRDFFAAPTVRRLAERIDGASGERSEPLRPVARRGRGPVSSIQRRLWFFDRLEPESAAYNLSLRMDLDGTVDVEALVEALNVVVARHEALRTRFAEDDGLPFSLVQDEAPIVLQTEDLRASPDEARSAEVERRLTADAKAPFDLERAPLLRARLIRTASTGCVLGLTMHHIAADGWSLGVLVRDLFQSYEALAEGRAPELPALPIQYGDYAAWEQAWQEGAAAERQLEYWRERLAGPMPVVDLPRDFSRPESQTFRGGSRSHRLPPDLTGRVAQLSRTHGATPFMTLLAAFALLVHRLTGLEDLPIGVPVSGRNREETERLVGVFINTVVARLDLSGDPTFAELLERTRSLSLEAYRNAELPFERVVEALRPERDPGRTPLFQVMFNSIDLGGRRRLELPDLAVDVRGTDGGESKFDLTLYVGADADETALVASYNADLYRPERIEGLLEQYEALVEQVVAHPERALSKASVLTDVGRSTLPDPTVGLRPWQGDPVTVGVSRHAAQKAERAALVDPRASLDYATVDGFSGGLAARLREAGLGSGDVVALYGRRSVELVWGMLGVLRAGAAFVILDPDHPAARVADCLRLSKARAWLEVPGLEDLGDPVRQLLDQSTWALRALLEPGLTQSPGEGLESAVPGPDGVAYVAFTSGTTGGVKGIVGTHGPLAHFVSWHARTFDLGPDDRFSMLSGLSHDPLLRDVFSPLHVGATLSIPAPEIVLEPVRLRDWMVREGITVTHLTPSLARVVVEGAGQGELPQLRHVFFGGETLSRELARAVRRVAPSADLINFYGATETPQAVAWHRVSDEEIGEGRPTGAAIPLGRGRDDVQLLVLTEGGQLAGPGELGEIGVRTPHLARGYLDDESLTRERFVASPFSGVPQDQLYRTGDLGRYRPDGLVEFAQRRDDQVKVRGYRVELGAVERVLQGHPRVRQSAVLAGADGADRERAGETRLVAYLALDGGESPTVTELRRFMRNRVPDHMVPSEFVTLDSLPLTPNGKPDRVRLATTAAASLRVEEALRPPRTEAERFVAEVWREALGIDDIDIGDNFFDLGGHSLLAIRVLSRIEHRTGQRLNPREMVYQPLERFAAGLAIGPAEDPLDSARRRGAIRRLWSAVKGAVRGPAPS